MTSLSFKKGLILLCCGNVVWAQPDLPGCEWTQFLHENQSVASEGCLVNGIPEGVWSNYSDRGILESRGARVANQPDGRWEFFHLGALQEAVMFSNGRREGMQVLWKEGVVTDSIAWINNQKEGVARAFRPDGSLIRLTPFKSDVKEGKEVLFNESGGRIEFRWYKNNRLINSEQFNRFNEQGERSGPWKEFHPSGRVIETGFYRDGLRHGLFQWYDARGQVTRCERYRDGELLTPEELKESLVVVMETKNEAGNVVESVTMVDGVKEGPTRQFNEAGEVVSGSEYEGGMKVGEGITLMTGERNGFWREFDEEGNLLAEGEYAKDLRVGPWKFYRDSGELEQEGVFVEGAFDGAWTWWYPGGNVHRLEHYRRGVLDGEFVELDTAGNPIVKGMYLDGLEEGLWLVEVQEYVQEGQYVEGLKHGVWTHTYPNNSLQFEGEWYYGQPEGKHKQWHPNGVLKEVGCYQNGVKHKKWREFNPDGTIHRQYIYRYGKLRRLDGVKVDKRRDGKTKASKE